MSARVVISEFMDEEAVERLRSHFDVLYDPALVDHPEELREAARACDALIVRNRTQVKGELLDAMSRAKLVGRLGVGLDNIDVAGCRARGITVIPAIGANATAVAEYVIATSLLLVRRGAYAASPEVVSGAWPRPRYAQGGEVMDRVLGLVGFGRIAREVARRAPALGLSVVAHDPLVERDDPVWSELGAEALDLDGLLEQADIVSLHLPLNDDTRRLFDAATLAKMKPGAVLINTSRGGIVDEGALAAALRSRRLGGAALDVFEAEPLKEGGPLADAPNLIATPHIAGVTVESNRRVSALIAERVIAALEG